MLLASRVDDTVRRERDGTKSRKTVKYRRNARKDGACRCNRLKVWLKRVERVGHREGQETEDGMRADNITAVADDTVL